MFWSLGVVWTRSLNRSNRLLSRALKSFCVLFFKAILCWILEAKKLIKIWLVHTLHQKNVKWLIKIDTFDFLVLIWRKNLPMPVPLPVNSASSSTEFPSLKSDSKGKLSFLSATWFLGWALTGCCCSPLPPATWSPKPGFSVTCCTDPANPAADVGWMSFSKTLAVLWTICA